MIELVLFYNASDYAKFLCVIFFSYFCLSPTLVDDTITHKRNKKSAPTKKHTQLKDVTTPRNKTVQHLTKDEERVVRTDEIALFMRCKKRPCDAEVQPIPPAPGGWDDVVPDRTISWGEMKSRSTTSERSHPHAASGKRSDNSQTLREDKNKANSRHDFAHHGSRQVSYSKPKPTTKLNNMEGSDMSNWGKSIHTSEANQPWRDKLTLQPRKLVFFFFLTRNVRTLFSVLTNVLV
jgi:hypothetical protein